MAMKLLAEDGSHLRSEADKGLMLEYWATPGISVERIVRLGRPEMVNLGSPSVLKVT